MTQGERCYLRILTVADVSQDYVDWMNDPEIMRFTEARFQSWSQEDIKNFVQQCEESDGNYLFGIFDKETNVHIGNIKLGPVNRHHRYASIGLVIGRKDYWGKGIGTEAIRLVCEFGFNDLKLRKLTAGAYATNKASIKAFQKCGFRGEGQLKRHYLDDGCYVDAVLLGRLNGE